MRAPLSWLRELAEIPAGTAELARVFTDGGLQVERVEDPSAAISGDVVVGCVLDFVEEPQKNGKTIRWCHVDVGSHNPPGESARGIVCGARNFAIGDKVAVALAGTTLPGGFKIASRKTYGHVSDGMICAEDELGLGEDHAGIMVLPPDAPVGADALEVLGARDVVFEIDVTPDEGHCLSIRGLAREAAQLTGGTFTDPFATPVPAALSGQAGGVTAGYPVRLESPACPLFTAIRVNGIDPNSPTPPWMTRRLRAAGMRPIFLAVDITNYVLLESGQPLHGYDARSLRGPIVVRQAHPGEHLTTLDKIDRTLSPSDMLITDDSGPIGLAGVMGGLTTELQRDTTDVLIEAAWFEPASIGGTYRRHKLPSEASRRFERGVDQGLAFAAGRRAAELLRDLAGGVIDEGYTVAGAVQPMPVQTIDSTLPGAILGYDVPEATVIEVLRASGVAVIANGGRLTLTPPTWRRDLVDPYDYVEEVGRKLGFASIPSRVPTAPAGLGYTPSQRTVRAIVAAMAAAGLSETITLPFLGDADLDKLGLPGGDPRRATVRVANPLSDAQPCLRSTLLPGLLAAGNRNTSRSIDDVALFELGAVFLATGDARPELMPSVATRPSDAEIADLFARLPDQPRHLGVVLTGHWLPTRWDAQAEPVSWRHAMALAEAASSAAGVVCVRRAAEQAPWHPGRCAQFGVVGVDTFVPFGWAGELHPSAVAAWGLPAGACAVELDVDALLSLGRPEAGELVSLSASPAVKQDVALVVDDTVPAAAVERALRLGAGPLLESISLFDVFTGPQLGSGRKSLAYSLVFRADRTLTEAEASQARDAAVASATQATGAVLRT